MLILCHKDGGVLAGNPEETAGLYGCGCISGYVRGFEPKLNRDQAIAEQVKETNERIKLFVGQGRSDDYIAPLRERLTKLQGLK